MAFKIFRRNCCGLDVHKTWIYACIGITDANSRTEYKQARFSSFRRGLQDLAEWLAKYSCTEVCMESAGKYWIPVFKECYRRIKARRGHKKAVIAICRMLLTAIWNILSKGEPYSAEGYLTDGPTAKTQVLTTQQALNLLKSRGVHH